MADMLVSFKGYEPSVCAQTIAGRRSERQILHFLARATRGFGTSAPLGRLAAVTGNLHRPGGYAAVAGEWSGIEAAELISVGTAAARAGISRPRIYRLVRKGYLKSVRHGRRIYIEASAIPNIPKITGTREPCESEAVQPPCAVDSGHTLELVGSVANEFPPSIDRNGPICGAGR